MIIVIGAGLTGLSAAYHLQDEEDVLVLEREGHPGGLCRSTTQVGFTFDVTGHLLHLRRPEIKELVHDLVPPDRFEKIDRRAYIYSHGVFTPYPFQVNTHGLPPEVVSECLTGFVEAIQGGEVGETEIPLLSFREWVMRTFGAGIARHFMIPYNEKLWLTDLDEMTCDWVSWSIPRPTLKDVVDGALGISDKAFGYNPNFLYPKQGGIRILPEALARRVRNIRCQTDVVSIDAERRTVSLSSGESIPYHRLISTVPLPVLLRMTDGLAPAVVGAARRLRHVAVVNVNFGVNRVIEPDKHWVYFPEKDFVFYRAGFPASFTPAAAPPGCSSLYIEIAVPPGETFDTEKLCVRARKDLVRAGLLREDDDILTTKVFCIDPAYVIYDRHRRDMLPRIQGELRRRGIRSAGRYGAWYYNSMEDSLAEGRALTHAILTEKGLREDPRLESAEGVH